MAGVLIYLYGQALGEKNDIEDELAVTQTELEASESELGSTNERLLAVENEARDLEGELADAMAETADAEEVAEQAQADLAEADDALLGFLTLSIGEGFSVEADTASCIADSLYTTRGRQVVTDLVDLAALESPEMSADLMQIAADFARASEACGAPMDGAMGLAPGFTYGDNPELDQLWDRCADGAGAACDTLYNRSEFGSEYERFGATCGDRFDLDAAPMFCLGNM
jgi:hypothetical protein